MFYDSKNFCKGFITSLLTYCTIHYLLLKLIQHDDQRQQRKRVNITTSFINSILCSVLGLYCVIEEPRMCTTDIISTLTINAYLLVAFEMGYFLFDSIDNLRKTPTGQTYAVLLHHFIILFTFGITVVSGRYIGYAILSLFIETNSIFLHFRQLLIFWNYSKQSMIYRVNNILNFLTFLIFRFGIPFYMSIWLVNNSSQVSLPLCIIGHSGLFIMLIINISLLYRLIQSDLFLK